jgi:hypothetical protein
MTGQEERDADLTFRGIVSRTGGTRIRTEKELFASLIGGTKLTWRKKLL